MKSKAYSIALLTILILLVYRAPAHETTSGIHLQYKIMSANTGNVTWFSPDYSTSSNYTFDGVDTVEMDLNNLSSSAEINVTIGNFEVVNYPDSSIDSNLILSYWEINYDLGVVANTSWDAFNGAANSATTITSYNFTESTSSFLVNEENLTRDTVVIDIDAGSQKTSLVYEKESGLLLEANTGFGNYNLHMKISEISDSTGIFPSSNTSSSNSSLPFSEFVFFISATTIAIIFRRKR